MKNHNLVAALALVAIFSLAAVGIAKWSGGTKVAARHQLLVPIALEPADYQTAEDTRLMAWLQKADESAVMKALNAHVLKPLVADYRARKIAIEGIEIKEGQCSQLMEAVTQCVKILHLKVRPKVFVSTHSQVPVCCVNCAEPTLVVDAALCDRFREPAELRFLIGRELGHIQAGHVHWLSFVRWLQSGSVGTATWLRFGIPDGRTVLLPILRWARETEMSADNAGCICAQDGNAVERTLVRMATGLDNAPDFVVNANDYLRQVESRKLSKASEVEVLFEQLGQAIPFPAERIRQVRRFQLSRRYRDIWERR